MHIRHGIPFLGILALCAGCAVSPPPSCASPAFRVTSDTLYFGRGTPQGPVSAAQWSEFLAAVVTPRFPQGLTVWEASGQWRSADGNIVHEASYVLAVVHPDDSTSDAAIGAIIQAYKTQFHQEAVLRVRSPGCASL